MGLGVLAVIASGCSERTPVSSPAPLQGEVAGVASSPARLSKGGGIFADDLGPETLDVSAYPGPIQGGARGGASITAEPLRPVAGQKDSVAVDPVASGVGDEQLAGGPHSHAVEVSQNSAISALLGPEAVG